MIITGLARLGADAVVRHTPKGDAVANLSLAFNYGQKGDDGKRPSQWIDASLWGKRAESLASHLLKGTSISVVLEDPHIETYEGKNGLGHKLVAKVMDIEFAGNKADSNTQSDNAGRAQRAPTPTGGGSTSTMEDFEDLPF